MDYFFALVVGAILFFKSRKAAEEREKLSRRITRTESDLSQLTRIVTKLQSDELGRSLTKKAAQIDAPHHEEAGKIENGSVEKPKDVKPEETDVIIDKNSEKLLPVEVIAATIGTKTIQGDIEPPEGETQEITPVFEANEEKLANSIAANVEHDEGPEPIMSEKSAPWHRHVSSKWPTSKPLETAPKTDEVEKLATKSAAEKLGVFLAKAVPDLNQEGVDWETMIGRQWLNIIGIVILIIGFVLLIQQSILYLGAGGKVALGLAVSGLLIGAGLYQERREAYRIFARTLVGGGWALLYFMVYAAYNIEVAKVIESETVALLLLLCVTAGIIAHSFFYRSELINGLAYGLGFLAIHLTPISFYSLIAVAILSGSILFVIRFTSWRIIGLLTIVATYGTHARWLAETQSANKSSEADILLSGLSPETAFWANIGLLSLYWLIYCAAALVRPAGDERARLVDLGMAVLNVVGLLSLSAWQMSAHIPGNLHFLFAIAAIGSSAVAFVDYRRGRLRLSLFNGSTGVALFAVALPLALIPEALSGDWLAPYWAIGAAFIWFIGYRSRQQLYRYEAYMLALFALWAAIAHNFAGPMEEHTRGLWFAGLLVLVLFEGFAEILRNPKKQDTLDKFDGYAGLLAVPASAALICLATWSLVPIPEVGILWAAIGSLMLETGGRSDRQHLRLQSYLVGLVAFVAFSILNLQPSEFEGILPGWSYALMGAGVFYLASQRLLFAGWTIAKDELTAAALPSALATILFAVSTYQALPLAQASLVWTAWALVVLEFGGRTKQFELRLLGYLLGLAAFLAFIILNFGGFAALGNIPSWVYTIVGAGLFYVSTTRLLFANWMLTKLEELLASAPAALATILYAVSVYIALPLELVCVAWILWALVLQHTGILLKRVHISELGLVLGAASFVIAVVTNIYQIGMIEPVNLALNVSALGITTAGLYLLHFRFRAGTPEAEGNKFANMGAFLHAATLLLALLAWRELPSVSVALAWGAIGLATFEIGFKTGEVTFRRQSHLLLVAAFIRLFMANFISIGDAFGISHRLISVIPIIVTLYYLRGRMLELLPHVSAEHSSFLKISERNFGASLYAWSAAILMVVLARFEVGSAYAVAVWAPIFLVLLILGHRLDVRDFRFQSYILALLIIARSWSTNVYLEGTLFGLEERIVTTLPAIAALLIGVVLVPPGKNKLEGPNAPRINRLFRYFDLKARSSLAVLFSLLVALLIFYQLSIDLVSIGWAVEALLLFVLGFALKERSFRLLGLSLLLVCVFKVTLLDLQGVETIFRILSFIVLGIILLLVSLGYSRYRDVMKRYF